MDKKKYIELERVIKFFRSQSEGINNEYNVIVNILEKEGKLQAPFGEKVNKELFAIRIISAGNVRIFYVYGKDNYIYGLHSYVKKTREIPKKELNLATKIAKELKKNKLI
jgi:phage-related protein